MINLLEKSNIKDFFVREEDPMFEQKFEKFFENMCKYDKIYCNEHNLISDIHLDEQKKELKNLFIEFTSKNRSFDDVWYAECYWNGGYDKQYEEYFFESLKSCGYCLESKYYTSSPKMFETFFDKMSEYENMHCNEHNLISDIHLDEQKTELKGLFFEFTSKNRSFDDVWYAECYWNGGYDEQYEEYFFESLKYCGFSPQSEKFPQI